MTTRPKDVTGVPGKPVNASGNIASQDPTRGHGNGQRSGTAGGSSNRQLSGTPNNRSK